MHSVVFDGEIRRISDTWMKKVMRRYYPDESMENIRRVRSLGVELFGSFAGIAQQYLFYYEREQNKRRK